MNRQAPGKTNPYRRLETALMILLPLLALLVAAAVVIPAVKDYRQRYAAYQVSLITPEPTVEPVVLRLPPQPTETPFYTGDPFFGWQFDGQRYTYRDDRGETLTGLHQIDGKLYYFLPDGTKAQSLGVDVSFYNEDIDWQQVKRQGIDFAIIRVGGRGWGSGVIYDDVRTTQFLHNAHEAGLRLGVYFYSTAGSEREAAEEARAALGFLGGEQLELPVFIDVEQSGEYPDGRADELTREERGRVIDAFCRVIEAAGYEAGVYSGQYLFNRDIEFSAVAGRTVWLANYTASQRGQIPHFGGGYHIWQFTDRGNVKGISGHTDMDVIF